MSIIHKWPITYIAPSETRPYLYRRIHECYDDSDNYTLPKAYICQECADKIQADRLGLVDELHTYHYLNKNKLVYQCDFMGCSNDVLIVISLKEFTPIEYIEKLS